MTNRCSSTSLITENQTLGATTMNAQITYWGAATVLLEIGPFRLLTDPALDPAGSYRGAKLIGPPIPPDRIGEIDAVLLSHDQHGDNLDRAGRALLPLAGRVLTTTAQK